MGLKAHFEAFSYRVENHRQVIHACIAFERQHPMKTFTRHGRRFGEPFKTQGRIHEIAQNETCHLWFATQKQRCRLVQERFSERGITLDPCNSRRLELASERHDFFTSFASCHCAQSAEAPFEPCTRRIRPCLLYTSPSPRDRQKSRMPSSA